MLDNEALTLSLVTGPETLRPFPGVNVRKKGEPPLNLVAVSCTVMLETPAEELALNVSEPDGSNRCAPSGKTLLITGFCARTVPAPRNRLVTARPAAAAPIIFVLKTCMELKE